MDKSKLSVATITWARDDREEQVLRESLTSLAALNLPVFISDGGSHPDFLAFVNSFPHFTLSAPQGQGLWAQARTSLKAALTSQPDFICYTEPDKGDFFRQALPDFLAAAPDQDRVGVLLASRSAAGFATFPAFQQATETTINQCCAELIGPAVDYTYGPFLLRPELVTYVDLLPEHIGWGWRPFTFGVAHRLGYQVGSWQADMACPPDQRQDSPQERQYRIRQLGQNIEGLLLSTTVAIHH
jgi:hypothetical protein